MSLLTTLNDDMKAAMKAKDKATLTVIRMLKAAVQNEEIKLGKPLDEDGELTILSREMKQRNESLAEFKKAGRDDLVDKINQEILVVEKYLPKQLTDEEIRQLVQDAITKSGAASVKEFGKVMAIVMPQVKGKADGQVVNGIVKELLS
ncbi:GatB/YqeY domain-containing protein [Vagococcus acidifermentans]|uniref:Aspartyl-tRNA amidotransferase n=1 Tax=Vagococcus acidifermentans TaxID=564710 RepID=A0A430AY18_9ENTE|nr:GatB/YqeY domain-containing protein [Vagococcus acidifermentans]RSU12962.1 aspartyl-tRNA amidotransferase [Vagococcus acidifermentans]